MFLNLSDMYSSYNFFNIYQRDYEESGLFTFILLLLSYRYLTVIFPSSQRVDTHALGTKRSALSLICCQNSTNIPYDNCGVKPPEPKI